MMFLMATDKYNCSEKSLIENFALCSDHIILSRAFRNGYILNICNLIYTTRRSSLFLLLQFPKMMTVSTLFVIQFFFLFVLSNKVYLNPLQTLQCLQGQYSHTETFLTNFPCSKVRAGRTGGAGDSAGVVVLLRPRGGCVAGKIPAV